MRRAAAAVAGFLLLCGCWDYRGLNDITIVAGIALDQSVQYPDGYQVTLEIVESSGTVSKMGSRLIVSDGETISHAINNVAKQLQNDLFFGNTELMILGARLMERQGINAVIDAFLRDFSTRYNLILAVSRQETAKEILEIVPQEYSEVASYKVSKSLDSKMHIANGARVLELYQVYDCLTLGAENLALPAVELKEMEGRLEIALNGMAVFDGEYLAGFLEDEQVAPLLMLTERLDHGMLVVQLEGDAGPVPVTLEVNRSKPKLTVTVQGDTIHIQAKVDLVTSAIEVSPELPSLSDRFIRSLEQRAGEAFEKDIREMVEDMQRDGGYDVFGFGTAVYRQQPDAWKRIAPEREKAFREMEFEIQCKVVIGDTGLIMGYKK